MPALDSKLRSQLDTVCQKAREKAEEAAQSTLRQKHAVDAAEPHAHFKQAEKVLRNRLRARGRQAGDERRANKTQSIDQLSQELAYEYWHRMLFARFLAENHLLMHPDGVAVSLEECEELAKELSVASCQLSDRSSLTTDNRQLTTAPNGFALAAQYASKMLPQVFRTDDVLLEIEFAPEHRLALEKLLTSLPRETFLADDSLGWVYQFWQTARKKQVNESGNKIDARTISSVTQLFTEDYMVQFLLHNTLGAWWAGNRLNAEGAETAETEAELRKRLSLPGVDWEYLRFVRESGTEEGLKHRGTEDTEKAQSEDLRALCASVFSSSWRPAAGKFEGWPKTLKEFTLLDPCCGSGHFLVAAFNLLVPLRMHDEGLSAREACDAVLRENLFGLELDPRCTQIAAFALAVAAWKFPNVVGSLREPNSAHGVCGLQGEPLGYRPLPALNIACAGIGPQATEDEWVKLAQQSGYRLNAVSRGPILDGLRDLHALFSNAPTLGSLINPNRMERSLISVDYETLEPYLTAALTSEQSDDDAHERAVAAAGMVKAAELLAGEYTLVITNVPYLGRGKQDDTLKQHLEQHYPTSKADLATAFVERCLELCARDGTAALVTPQNWLFLKSYAELRESLLKYKTWNLVARLGAGAFETISGEVVNAVLLFLSAATPDDLDAMTGIDVSSAKQPDEKAALLRGGPQGEMNTVAQAAQRRNPDARIVFGGEGDLPRLIAYADSFLGLGTGDFPHYGRAFWELIQVRNGWVFEQCSVYETQAFGGREYALAWDEEIDRVRGMQPAEREQIHNQDQSGQQSWGKSGVAVALMGDLKATLYSGEKYEKALTVLLPKKREHLAPIWAFCSSDSFHLEVRRLDQKIIVANGTVAQVPFDLAFWQRVAAEKYPDGLPEPESDDPTQWLFHGRPESSTAPLQAAVARLLGYRWPAELQEKDEERRVGQARPSERRPTTTDDADGGPALETSLSHPTAPMRLSARARDLVRRCDELLPLADRDGLVPIPSVRGEPPAAERLLELLHAAYGTQARRASEGFGDASANDDPSLARRACIGWSNSVLHDLLTQAGCKPGTTLDDWLRNVFFEQHCKLFHNRPFIWHLWDGRKDGFGCLVNYHQLNHKGLENLTYSYLQDWITAQAAQAKLGKTGADLRLAAAQALQDKLKLILTGEPPYDIFVRWKPLAEQAIGWHPDLNDGVRMNIRPFIQAGILRKNPNIKWTKDRGKEPQRDKADYPWFWSNGQFTGDRVNDVHWTNSDKLKAIESKGKKS